MALLPKSKKARRRLGVVLAAAVVLGGAAALAVFALGDSLSAYYSPSKALEAQIPAGRRIQLGGLVVKGSVQKFSDGAVHFAVTDNKATSKVIYHKDLPDLFREGQGVITKGSFEQGGVFQAEEVVAKHDETYMPKEVADSLKEAGEWKGGNRP